MDRDGRGTVSSSSEEALAAITRMARENPRLADALAPALYALTPITLRVSVVIPCFNERESITTLLDRVQAVPIQKEVVVVDDCSNDGTRELLKQRADHKGDIVLRLMGRNGGKGAAVRE